MTDGHQTLDQRRAAHAWAAVEELPGKIGGDYAREAKRLPVRMLTSGLGHALAFLRAKSKRGDTNERLLHDLSDWGAAPAGASSATCWHGQPDRSDHERQRDVSPTPPRTRPSPTFSG